MTTILDFFEALQYPWVWRPLLTAIIISVVGAIVGTFMVLRKLVFFANGIAHSAFAGGALGLLLGFSSIPLILIPVSIFAICTALIVGLIIQKTKVSNETAIGILFSVSLALGVLFVNMYNQYNVNVSSLLFGSLASISATEFITVITFGSIILPLVLSMKKSLFYMTFDNELAQANGIPTKGLSFTFLILAALSIIICVSTVGIILVMAFIVTPAATAYQYTYRLNRLFFYSSIIGVVGSFSGFIIAYIYNLSSSALIALILVVFFIISMIISPKRRAHKMPDIDRKYCRACEHLVKGVSCTYCDIDALDHHDFVNEEVKKLE